jgi:hypothetical protein
MAINKATRLGIGQAFRHWRGDFARVEHLIVAAVCLLTAKKERVSQIDRPRFRDARPGPLENKSMTSDLVANVHSAVAGDPPPAAVSGHHDAAEAVAPVAMAPVAVMATTLAPTTLAPASSGSFGGDERGGADSGDGGESENRLADHGSLLGCYRMCSHILPDPSCERSVGFDSASICESQIAHFVMAITFAETIVRHVAPIR